ncbi:hypothetical protein O181_013668 [Austropuccinia psidii MF-1]|uniref:Uncharacterized protein n=1 Tax=Austropuccinia psidii MF-1 TaxID=1389203 RepID=A0A9Q3BZP8_9BASI|nr:hypothetical protein [Austropuccinia psidii MF-1]
MCQENINHQMCHMSMSLKNKTHIKTSGKFWVITLHGARKQFGMLIFVHEMTSSPPPNDLTPLPCLVSCMNWLLHHCLILSNPQNAYSPAAALNIWVCATPTYPHASSPLLHPQDMPPIVPPLLCAHPSLRFIFSAAYQPYTPILDP